MDGEAGDGSCRAAADTIFTLHENRWASKAIDQTGADDSDDAGVPVGMREDDGPLRWACHAFGLGHFDGLFEDFTFLLTSFGIQAIECFGDLMCAASPGGGQEFDGIACVSHATGGIDAGSQSEAHRVGVHIGVIESAGADE